MADKFRTTYPVKVTFVKGEQPKNEKIQAIGTQAKSGLSILEKAVGDIWNQSGDSNLIPAGDLFKNSLYISSIARALGDQSTVSPRIPDLPNIQDYKDVISSGVSLREGYLTFPPVATGEELVEADFTILSGGDAVSASQFKTDPDQVVASGDWHVTSSGLLKTFANWDQDIQLQYQPKVIPDISTTARFNVIPDPKTDELSTTAFNGLKLAYANDENNQQGYWLYLPPRRPLSNDRRLSRSPNRANNEDDATRFFFQDPTNTASTDAHFRYRFTGTISDIIDSAIAASSNQTVPSNFLQLVDTDTGTIIEGLTWTADSTAPTYVVKVAGTRLDEIVTLDSSLISAQALETSAAYKDRFRLVQPSVSAAVVADAAMQKANEHRHTMFDGSLPISYTHLTDIPPAPSVTVGTGFGNSKGDFNGEDETPFVKAIAALPDGGTIYVRKGTYTINSQITIATDGINIVGENKHVTKLQGAVTSGSLIRINSDGCSIRDIELTLTAKNVTGYGIRVNGTENLIWSCILKYKNQDSLSNPNGNTAVVFLNANRNVVQNNYFEYNTYGSSNSRFAVLVGQEFDGTATSDIEYNFVLYNMFFPTSVLDTTGTSAAIALMATNNSGAGTSRLQSCTVMGNISQQPSAAETGFVLVQSQADAGATATQTDHTIIGNICSENVGTNTIMFRNDGGGTVTISRCCALGNQALSGGMVFGINGAAAPDNTQNSVRLSGHFVATSSGGSPTNEIIDDDFQQF